MSKIAIINRHGTDVEINAEDILGTEVNNIFKCANPYCSAQMTLCSLHGKVATHFKALPSHPHDKNCPFKALGETTDYTTDNFEIDEFYEKLLYKKAQKKSDKNDKSATEEKTVKNNEIKSVQQLYKFCVTHTLSTKFGKNSLTVGNLICDNRNAKKFVKYITGKKLIVLRFYRYERAEHKLFFKYANSKWKIVATFSADVFENSLNKIYKYKNSNIIVFSEFKTIKDTVYTKIDSMNQFYISK